MGLESLISHVDTRKMELTLKTEEETEDTSLIQEIYRNKKWVLEVTATPPRKESLTPTSNPVDPPEERVLFGFVRHGVDKFVQAHLKRLISKAIGISNFFPLH